MLRKIKNKVFPFLYAALRKKRIPFTTKRLLIVRTDAIGDYILFRNIMRALKQHPDFTEYKFSLLGHSSVKSLAEEFDKDIIDEFIWVDHAVIYDRFLWPKIKLLWKLHLKKFTIVINPVHSRTVEVDEFIERVGAKRKIASMGDGINFSSKELYDLSSKKYDTLVPVMGPQNFEYFRNADFIRNLVPGSLPELPSLEFDVTKNGNKEKKTIILFPGASQDFRKWDAANFSAVINQLSQKNEAGTIRFIIAGANADKNTAKQILEIIEAGIDITDQTGQTSLPELVHVIASADLLISNETSAVHIAAGVKTPAICISNGNHFGRFNPYPAEIADFIYTYYPGEKFSDPQCRDQLIKECERQSTYDINQINPSIITEKAWTILRSAKQNATAVNHN